MTTVNTLLYEGNYQNILNDGSWFMKYSPSYEHRKLITVNNVIDKSKIKVILNEYQEKYKFDYFFVDDLESEALSFFKLDIDSKKSIGYFYQIPYYSLLMYLNTEYILNVSEDCSRQIFFNDDYIIDSINEIETNPKIFSTSLNWGIPKVHNSYGYELGQYEEMSAFSKREKLENKKFWHTEGFADNFFFTKVSKLRTINYNLSKIKGSPCQSVSYCPNCWETRVCEYVYQNDFYRGVYKNYNYYYFHEKYAKNSPFKTKKK